MAVLGYLPKSKRRLGLAFGAHFLHDFFPKSVLYYLVLYQIFFPSQDIKQNMLVDDVLDN